MNYKRSLLKLHEENKNMKLTSSDQQLITTAHLFIKKYYHPDKHKIATAIELTSGEIITAVNTAGSFGRIDTCAEQNAIGMLAARNLLDKVKTIVSVKYFDQDDQSKVASPCGSCREIICDYAPQAKVIVRSDNQLSKVEAEVLLPYRYSKT